MTRKKKHTHIAWFITSNYYSHYLVHTSEIGIIETLCGIKRELGQLVRTSIRTTCKDCRNLSNWRY